MEVKLRLDLLSDSASFLATSLSDAYKIEFNDFTLCFEVLATKPYYSSKKSLIIVIGAL